MSCYKKFDKENLIIIRGAGDLATGTAIRLHNAGFPIIMLEVEKPTVIRRTVSFASAVYLNEISVEGIKAVYTSQSKAMDIALTGDIPVIVDPRGINIDNFKPLILIDAILAKKNLGTSKDMADFVIALGPGFSAGIDCHAVIETQRGHLLGSVIYNGSAIPNTGIPGVIGGVGEDRVLHAPCAGVFAGTRKIGDIVNKNDIVGFVGNSPVVTKISGKLRGLLMDGLEVTPGFKVGDVDPRGEKIDHTTCSDKARAIAGGVLEAVMHFLAGF